MRWLWLTFLFLACIVCSNDIDLKLLCEFSIGNEPWQPRGNINFIVNKSDKKLSVKFENPTFKFNREEVIKLSSNWLRLRIPVVDFEGKIVPNKYLITSVRGCVLIKDPKELLLLSTDKTGALYALQYDRPASNTCEINNNLDELPKELEVASKITAVVAKEVPALPVPVLTGEILKPGDDSNDQKPPPQSFFQQYWYIIVPSIVLYTLLLGNPPEQPAPQAGQPSGAPSAPVASAGPSRKRRTGN